MMQLSGEEVYPGSIPDGARGSRHHFFDGTYSRYDSGWRWRYNRFVFFFALYFLYHAHALSALSRFWVLDVSQFSVLSAGWGEFQSTGTDDWRTS
jgi:hypothetical protein